VRPAVKSLRNFPDPFVAEIAGQPEAIRRAATAMQDQEQVLDRIAALRSVRSGTQAITFTGMGASHAAGHCATTLLARAGVSASLVDASELLHFRQPTLRPGSILVLVSQSGRSAEMVGLVGSLDGSDRPFVVSVTNGLSNPVADAADAPLDVRAGEERGPSTVTFAATLVACAALAETLAGRSPAEAVPALELEAARASAAGERLIEGHAELGTSLEAWLGSRDRMVVLGRGTGLAAAEAGALILKEAARIPAEALGTGQFRHGPLELAGPDLAVSILATEPETRDLDLRLAAELAEAGGAVSVIGEATSAMPAGILPLDVPPVSRALAPALSVIPLQLLAWRTSVRSGLAPGRLHIAAKVTTHE
jgi:glutamine---fructose-6-phosphate transaminase (isomerizing)